MEYKINDANLNTICNIIAKGLVIEEDLQSNLKNDEELYINHKSRGKLSKKDNILQNIITQAKVTTGMDITEDIAFNATGRKKLKDTTEWLERMIKGWSEELIVGISNEEQLTELNETAYRRGFTHGFDNCLKLNNSKIAGIDNYLMDLLHWRTEGNLNKIEDPPAFSESN